MSAILWHLLDVALPAFSRVVTSSSYFSMTTIRLIPKTPMIFADADVHAARVFDKLVRVLGGNGVVDEKLASKKLMALSMSKSAMQSPIESVIRNAGGAGNPEETAPVAPVVPVASPSLMASLVSARPASSAGGFVNPPVLPGKIAWHKDFGDACLKARNAPNRPVLLFLMLGRLDQKFC